MMINNKNDINNSNKNDLNNSKKMIFFKSSEDDIDKRKVSLMTRSIMISI